MSQQAFFCLFKNLMKFFLLFLILLACTATPLRVNAMEGFGDEIKKNQNDQNSSERLGRATETTPDENQDEAGRATGIGVAADPTVSDNPVELGDSRANLNSITPINVESIYLTQQTELAQRAFEKLKKQKDEIENNTLSPASSSAIALVEENDRAAWQETSGSYAAFLERTADAEISEPTRTQILNLIAASNKASQAAQEILDLFSKTEGAYVSKRLGSSFTPHEPLTASSRHEDLSSLLQRPPALDAKPLEDSEQQEMAHFFNSAAARNSQAVDLHYEAVDALVPQVQEAWNRRALLKQTQAGKKETLERATEQLKKEEEALANKDLEKTILGRIAMVTGKGAEGVANVPDPHSQIASVGLRGISIVADFFNKRRESAAFKKAKKTFEVKTQEESESSKMAHEAEEIAFEKDYELQELEKVQRKSEATATQALAESLKPPFLSTKENDWNNWGEKIATAAHLNRAWVSRIARKGKANPAWAAQKAVYAWGQRIDQSKNEIENYEKAKVLTLESPE